MPQNELEKQIAQILENTEVLAKAMADQQILTIRLLAQQRAFLTSVRSSLLHLGIDKAGLDKGLKTSYLDYVSLFHAQIQSYQQSGDLNAFLGSLVFEDTTL